MPKQKSSEVKIEILDILLSAKYGLSKSEISRELNQRQTTYSLIIKKSKKLGVKFAICPTWANLQGYFKDMVKEGLILIADNERKPGQTLVSINPKRKEGICWIINNAKDLRYKYFLPELGKEYKPIIPPEHKQRYERLEQEKKRSDAQTKFLQNAEIQSREENLPKIKKELEKDIKDKGSIPLFSDEDFLKKFPVIAVWLHLKKFDSFLSYPLFDGCELVLRLKKK